MNGRRMERVAGVGGIAGLLLIVGANVGLGGTPAADAAPAEVLAFFTAQRTPLLVGVVLFALGYVLLLTLGAAIRQRLRAAGDTSGMPDLAFGASLWTIVIGTVGQLAVGAAAFRAPELDAATAQTMSDVATLSFTVIGAAFAGFIGAASISAGATRAWPRWLTWVGAVAAVLNLAKLFTLFATTGPLAPEGLLTFAALISIWVWTIAVGVVLVVRPGTADPRIDRPADAQRRSPSAL